MKITDRGFSVTDLNIPDVKGIEVTYGDAGTVISILEEGEGAMPTVFTVEQWREFTAAVVAVNERLSSLPVTSTAHPTDIRNSIIDGDGDKWTPVWGTDRYTHSSLEKTREGIRSHFGIREG